MFVAKLRYVNLLTTQQAIKSVELCQSLSDLYRDIRLFRFNSRTNEIFILAGESIEILITSDGQWRFINEAEL